MSAVDYPPFVTKDTGLGSAYERIVIYRQIERWIKKYPIRTAMEGAFDGMAGIPGLHLIPAALTGTDVTVVCANETIAETVHGVYRDLGIEKRLRLIISTEWPSGETAELVMIFNALAFVPDWRGFLRQTVSRAEKYLLVSTTNPFCYGAMLCRMLRTAGLKRSEFELFDHPSTRKAALDKEIADLGKTLDRAYVDAPWWPDLFVKPGDSLLSGTLKSLPNRSAVGPAPKPSARSLRYLYGVGKYPYFSRTPEEQSIIDGILRQPNGDGGWLRPFRPALAHHRMTFIEVIGAQRNLPL